MTRSWLISLCIVALAGAARAFAADPALEQEKQALAQAKAELDALAGALHREWNSLSLKEREISGDKSELEFKEGLFKDKVQRLQSDDRRNAAESHAIDLKRPQLRYQFEVEFFNRRVDSHNARVRDLAAKAQALAREEAALRERRQALQAAVDRVAADWQNHEAGQADYRQREAAYRQQEQRHTINVKAYMAKHNVASATSTPAASSPRADVGNPTKRVIFDDSVPKSGNKR